MSLSVLDYNAGISRVSFWHLLHVKLSELEKLTRCGESLTETDKKTLTRIRRMLYESYKASERSMKYHYRQLRMQMEEISE